MNTCAPSIFAVLSLALAAGCGPESAAAPGPAAAQNPQQPKAQAPQAQEPQAQQPQQQDPAAQGRQLAADVLKQFRDQGIAIDTEKGTVVIPAIAIEPPDPVEYLLIHRRGKKHEAMFVTESTPSVLNAALLMLGFVPGKNADYREKDPPPTLEEIEQGADPLVITPPSGMEFWITVRWRDEQDRQIERCVEDLVLDLSTGKPVAAASWVFLGGRMARIYKDEPEVFVADFEGNLLSICYLAPDNHLGTMRHERSRDDQNWWISELAPKPTTKVEMVFHKQETALHKERRARLQQEAQAEPKKDGDKNR